MNKKKCPNDDTHKLLHIERFDTYACPVCLVWTENLHTPENCSDCPYEYPPEVPTEGIILEELFKRKVDSVKITNTTACNLECPYCDTCADFKDRNAQGIVRCPECGLDFDSTKSKAEAKDPTYIPWSEVKHES